MSEDPDDEAAEYSYDASAPPDGRDSPPDGRSRSDTPDTDDAPDDTATETHDGDDADRAAGTTAANETAGAVGADEPLGDVPDPRSTAEGSDGLDGRGEDSFTELFEETAVDELDSDRVWARLQADESGPRVDVRDRELREIDKRAYCHQCPHFRDPPDVGCSHDGTTILELVDVRTFRVANCPVVLEEESLEDG